MVCFLWDDLSAVIRSLMKRFVKIEVLSENWGNLVKVDVADKQVYKNYKDIDMGFSCEKIVKEAKPSER